MSFVVSPLAYAYDALEPFIDAQTMTLHHDKHHVAYCTNLNAAIEKAPELASWSLEDLMVKLNSVPDAVKGVVRNHGGGHFNHEFFWSVMAPAGSTTLGGKLLSSIEGTFGSVQGFKDEFGKAAMGRFGSGWAWLVKQGDKLVVTSSANQDCPLTDGATPLLALDVWEHAYYLKYQNRRADYVSAWWNVINWDAVAKNLG